MTTVDRLLDKSKEAFVMAIEVYNKPTIRYRLEGFSFFICNAWELMLKAYLIKRDGEQSIYYPDSPDRTISLENCIHRIFTNKKAPLCMNLAKIIELRNTSTHFITEEYEMMYVPLLQACVFNFVDKMNELHQIDMTQVIPENFIALSVRVQALDEIAIRAKYPAQISERLVKTQQVLAPLVDSSGSAFAIRMEHRYFQTKNREEAGEFYHIDNKAAEGVRIIKELKSPNETHKYNAKACIKEIKRKLTKQGIVLLVKGETKEFNMYHFNLIVDYFQLKSNERYCYIYQVNNPPTYSYSLQAIDFIFEEIRKNPGGIIDDLKQRVRARKTE